MNKKLFSLENTIQKHESELLKSFVLIRPKILKQLFNFITIFKEACNLIYPAHPPKTNAIQIK